MAYFKPYIDETGYHYPTYNDTIEHLIDKMQTIYGSGIYLGNDSPDYEMLSVFAEIIYDTYQAGEILYNSQSPETAIGVGLDYQAALNGISRKQPTKSSAVLLLTGTPGTVIAGGVCADSNGYVWDIDGTVTLDGNGTGTATAYCREYGNISAAAGSIARIMTPMLGWTSVTNEQAAAGGTIEEKDSELRARRKQSVALPSSALIDGLRSAILAFEDVVRCKVYENYTSTTDANGIPPHTVCCVIDGGNTEDLANAIFLHKGNGCGTYGGPPDNPNCKTVTVYDAAGEANIIHFAALSRVQLSIVVHIMPRAGYLAENSPDAIRLAIIDYLSEFAIGADVDVYSIQSVAATANEDMTHPTFSVRSVTAAKPGNEQSTDDVMIAFNEVAYATPASITILDLSQQQEEPQEDPGQGEE